MKKLKFSDSKKIVIKIGTSTITNDDGFDKEFLDKLSSEVSSWIDNGIGVVIVSSGAIFAGLRKLKVSTKPNVLSELQAAAAIGQMDLAQVYKDVFTQNNKIAARLSLSPNCISSVETVSFSLIIGTTPLVIKLLIVDLAFKYRFLSLKSSWVSKTWAAILLFCENMSLYACAKSICPIAAAA